MFRFLLLAALGLLAAAPRAQAQERNRVANYYAGTPGTASYEHFSFWSTAGRRGDMQYSQGAGQSDQNDATLRYAGPTRLQGQPAFKVRFAGGKVLYVAPRDTALLVATSATAAPKIFQWEYQGPVNGVGTACSVCTPDAKAAVQLVQGYFVR